MSSRVRIRLRSLAAAFAGAGALGAALPAAADGGAAVVRPAAVRHEAAVSAANALIAEVRVSLDRAARVYVEYDNPQAGRYRTALSEAGTEHVIPIVRLRPQTTYDYTIFVIPDGEAAASGGSGRFTTGPLPPPLAAVPVRVSGRSSQPLILSDLRRWDRIAFVVFRDETGSVVWYYHEPGHPKVVDRLPGGDLIVLNGGGRLTVMTPLGEVIDREQSGRWRSRHHDVTVLDDGRMIYPSKRSLVVDDSANGGAADTGLRVDRLLVWDPESGSIEQVWDAKETWDMTDPNQRVRGRYRGRGYSWWTHLNSVSAGPRGNLILSLRGRNQVVSLSPDFRTVEWQLHGPYSDFAFPDPTDRFYGQHTASQLANGNVLLFDNGWHRPEAEGGRYSRALELRLDAAAGTAVKVWEYRTDPDTYIDGWGSAYRLSNGNTLINFSKVEAHLRHAPLVVVEVDAAGGEVFRLESLPRWPWADEPVPYATGRYRVYGGITAIMGETMLRPPAAAYAPEHGEMVADGFTVVLAPAGE